MISSNNALLFAFIFCIVRVSSLVIKLPSINFSLPSSFLIVVVGRIKYSTITLMIGNYVVVWITIVGIELMRKEK